MRAETTNPATTAGYAVFTGWILPWRLLAPSTIHSAASVLTMC